MDSLEGKWKIISQTLTVIKNISDKIDGKYDHKLWEEVLPDINEYSLSEDEVIRHAHALIWDIRKYIKQCCNNPDERKIMEMTLQNIVSEQVHLSEAGLSKAEVLDWFLSEKEVIINGESHQKPSILFNTDELHNAIKSGNAVEMNRAIHNLLIGTHTMRIGMMSDYDKVITEILRLMNWELLPREQKIQLIIEVAHQRTNTGSSNNLVMRIYEEFKNEEYMQDSRVQEVYQYVFEELEKERKIDHYSESGITLPRLNESTPIKDKRIRFVVHPLFEYMDTHHEKNEKLTGKEKFEKYILEKFNQIFAREKLSGDEFLYLLSIIDSIEEYHFLKNRNDNDMVVLALPKWIPDIRNLDSERSKMIHHIQLLNELFWNQKDIAYLETRDTWNGYLYPEDIKLLRQTKQIEVAGGYLWLCINNANSDLPKWTTFHPTATSSNIRSRVPWYLLEQAIWEEWKDKYIDELNWIIKTIPKKWFTSFQDLEKFYESNIWKFQEYNSLFSKLLIWKSLDFEKLTQLAAK